MKFKKVSDNKIIVMLSGAELESRDIDISNIKDNSVAYQKLFWDMMERAQSELGFDVSGSQLMVETAPDINGNILITITKSGSGKIHSGILERMVSEILGNSIEENIQNVNLLENEVEPEFENEVLCFSNIENAIEFSKSLTDFVPGSSSLYSYENKYFIVIKRTKRNNKGISTLLEKALEFNGEVSDSYLMFSMLEERGNKIIKSKAIKTLIENF